MDSPHSQKSLTSPADRRIPVNLSIPLRVLDAIDEESFRMFGTVSGKRSETVVKIIKDYLHIL